MLLDEIRMMKHLQPFFRSEGRNEGRMKNFAVAHQSSY